MSQARHITSKQAYELWKQARELRVWQEKPNEALNLLLPVTSENHATLLYEAAECYADLGNQKKAKEIFDNLVLRVKNPRTQKDIEKQLIVILKAVTFELKSKTTDFDKINELMKSIVDQNDPAVELAKIEILARQNQKTEALNRLSKVSTHASLSHIDQWQKNILLTKYKLSRIFKTRLLSDEDALTLFASDISPSITNGILVNVIGDRKFNTIEEKTFLNQLLEKANELITANPNNPIYLSTYASILCKGDKNQIKAGFELHHKINKNHPNYCNGFISHAYDLIAHGSYETAIEVLENVVDVQKRKSGISPKKSEMKAALKTILIAYDNKIQSTGYGRDAKSQLQKRIDEERRNQYYQRVQDAPEAKSATAKRTQGQTRTYQKGKGAEKTARELFSQAFAADPQRFYRNHPNRGEIQSSIQVEHADYSALPLVDADGFRLVTVRHHRPLSAMPTQSNTEEKKTPELRQQASRKVSTPASPERVHDTLSNNVSVALPRLGLGLELLTNPNTFGALKNKGAKGKVLRGTAMATDATDAQTEQKATSPQPTPRPAITEAKVTVSKRISLCDKLTQPIVSRISLFANSASQTLGAAKGRLLKWENDLDRQLTYLITCRKRHLETQEKQKNIERLKRRIGR